MTARSNEVFFERKKPWSGIKDDLLRCYLKPYITKILIHGGPVRYIDCFAGAGKFEDGSDGSPLIALKEIREAVEKSHAKNKDVKLYFIEKSHSETLKNVLGERSACRRCHWRSFRRGFDSFGKQVQICKHVFIHRSIWSEALGLQAPR